MPATYTSRAAYREHILDGGATTQRARIMECILLNNPITRLQISKLTGITINAVTARMASLMDSERPQVVKDSEAPDPESGYKAEFLKPVELKPVQQPLF